MNSSEAWLIECDQSLRIAVGDHEMVELVPARRCHAVPAAPAHCAHVLPWQQLLLPVMDLGALHRGGRQHGADYLCVLNLQPAPGAALEQLALPVTQPPERILVSDAQFCELPPEFDDSLLASVTLSCFTHHANPVLIIDLGALCSARLRDLAAA